MSKLFKWKWTRAEPIFDKLLFIFNQFKTPRSFIFRYIIKASKPGRHRYVWSQLGIAVTLTLKYPWVNKLQPEEIPSEYLRGLKKNVFLTCCLILVLLGRLYSQTPGWSHEASFPYCHLVSFTCLTTGWADIRIPGTTGYAQGFEDYWLFFVCVCVCARVYELVLYLEKLPAAWSVPQ